MRFKLYFISNRIPKLLSPPLWCNKRIRSFSSQVDSNLPKEETQANSEKHYDIVISGGGLVGFAAACALGQNPRLSDRKILLLERQRKKEWIIDEEFSNRVFALNASSQALFTKVGAWDHIKNCRVCPVTRMQVWDACSEAMITFSEDDIQETIAHIVENEVIMSALEKEIPGNVEISYGSKITSYELPSSLMDDVKIRLEDSSIVSTDLLIGADGAKSQVRKTMGSHYLSWEYDQMGIVATLILSEESENHTAWQKFLPSGPLAFLPLSPTRSSLVWSTTKIDAKNLTLLSDVDFADALNNAIWCNENVSPLIQVAHERWQTMLQTVLPWKGSFGMKPFPPSVCGVVPGSIAAFPLGLGHSSHYVGHRVALVGDAAHRVHPLAGQGVNLGFGDVAELVSVLENSVLQGCDIGDVNELYRYESSRQKYNVATMAAIDALYRLHSTSSFPAVFLRTLGVSAFDAVQPLKKRIMQHAKGDNLCAFKS